MAQTTYILSLRDRVTKTALKVQQSLGGVTRSANNSSAAMQTIGLAAGGLALLNFFKLGAELETTQLKFETLSGSIKKGQKLYEGLTKFANETPFQDDRLNKNASTLLAFGTDSESVVKTLKMLGDVSAGSQDRLDSLTLAFSQSRSAGRLMGQDLLQFINAGFNPLQIIAEKTGKSMLSLKKAMEKGQIPFKFVQKAFESATRKGGKFYNLTLKMSSTMAGRWSTAMGKGKRAIQEFSLSMKGVFVPFIEGLIKTINKFSKFRAAHEKLVSALGTGIVTFGAVVIAVGALGLAFSQLWAVMASNPILFVIGLLIGLVAALEQATDLGGGFGETLALAWARLKLDARSIARLFTDLGKIIQTTFKAIELAAIGQLKSAGDEFAKAGGVFRTLGQYNKEEIAQYEKDVLAIVNKVNKAKPKLSLPEIDSGNLNFDFGGELKKLQANGVVSGGLKVFNINIASLTGINTLSTTSIEGGAMDAGAAVNRALLETLADVKNLG